METDEQVARLESLNSSYRTSTEVKDGRQTYLVQLVDLVTGATWHEASGQSHADALATALNSARVSSKPKTTAEAAAEAMALADENAKLRELVEQLKLRGAVQPEAQEEAAAPSTRRKSGT